MAAPSSSSAVPSCVFSALSALSGPVAVVGSRELSVPALQAIARFGRWLGRKRRPPCLRQAERGRQVWSGGALGADSAASAGALAQGGAVRWWLSAAFAQLPVGSPAPAVRGPAGAFPLSAPRALARSVSCVPWAGGPASLPFHARLFQRTRTMLLSLQGAGQGAVVAFIGQQALLSRKGGSWFSVREALRLGFAPGESLFVVAVGASAFQAVAPEAVRHSFLLPAPQQLSPEPVQGIPAQGLNWSRSPAAGRGNPHGERYDSQTVSGPLSQAFWLGLCFRR